jgi:hypothetical protein
MPGRHRAGSWWERQGYRKNHPVHGTEVWSRGRDDEEAKFMEQEANEQRGGPVDITVNPTRTSDPGRPRTLAMGYDHGTDTLRVVFREGAVYDYFGVSTAEWWGMRRSASPGRFINRRLADHEYTRVQ